MAANPDIQTYLDSLNDEVRPIADALRSRIIAVGPTLSPGLAWGFPCWAGHERIISILGHKAHVNLQLWSGARLAKQFPKRIEGTGKSLRHVKLRALTDIDDELDAIILAAIHLDKTDPQKVR